MNKKLQKLIATIGTFSLLTMFTVMPARAAVNDVTIFAGAGSYGYAEGDKDTWLADWSGDPGNIATDGEYIYFGDPYNNCIRRVLLSTGDSSPVAGLCASDGSGTGDLDGIGDSARLTYPGALTIDRDNGILYFVDRTVYKIKKLTLSTSEVVTLAGDSSESIFQEGTGINGHFGRSHGIVFDEVNNCLYFADPTNGVIAKLDLTNNFVSLFGGNPGVLGEQDGDLLTEATFNGSMRGLSMSRDKKKLYLSSGQTIRRIDLETLGVVTIIGQSSVYDYVEGIGTEALTDGTRLAVEDDQGNYLYFSSRGNDNIRRVNLETLQTELVAGGTLSVSENVPGNGAEAQISGPSAFVILGNYIYTKTDNCQFVKIEINNPPATDSTPPTFVTLPGLSAPINITEGQTITTNPYIIKVKPNDDNGIQKVEFYVDDNLLCTDTIADADGVYECSWDTSKYHSDIRVLAYDNSGNPSLALARTAIVDPSLYTLPRTGMNIFDYVKYVIRTLFGR